MSEKPRQKTGKPKRGVTRLFQIGPFAAIPSVLFFAFAGLLGYALSFAVPLLIEVARTRDKLAEEARRAALTEAELAAEAAADEAASIFPTFQPELPTAPLSSELVGIIAVAIVVLCVLVFFLLRRRLIALQPGVPGKTRVGLLSIGVMVLSAAATTAMFFVAQETQLPTLTGYNANLIGVLEALPPDTRRLVLALTGVSACFAIMSLFLSWSTWFLISKRARTLFMRGVDALLIALSSYAFLELSLKVEEVDGELAPGALVIPSIALSAYALTIFRLAVRISPWLIRQVANVDFRPLVASRHLLSEKSGFLTAIGGLSIFAVAMSTCLLATVLSVMGGFRDDLKQKIIGSHAHIVVDAGASSELEGWDPVLEEVRGVDGVIAATPFLEGEVMITSASNREGVLLRGIDPETLGDVTSLDESITSGDLAFLSDPARALDAEPNVTRTRVNFAVPEQGDEQSPSEQSSSDDENKDNETNEDEDKQSNDGALPSVPPIPIELLNDLEETAGSVAPENSAVEDLDALRGAFERDQRAASRLGARTNRDAEDLPGIMIGRELARSLRLFVGDELDVISPFGTLGPAGPMPKSRSFRVVAIFYTGMYEYDMKRAYVLLSRAQSFFNKGDAITGIEARVADIEESRAVGQDIEHALAGTRNELRVRDWQELNRNLFGALALEKLAMFVTLGIAILIAGFCVFGTLTLMVQEKSREVGILCAMGTSPSQVVSIFLIEGFLIGLYGAFFGLGLGFLNTFVIEHFGIRIDPEVYYIDRLPVLTDPVEFIAVGLAAIAVCVVATIFPAVLASRVNPADALRQS